MTKCGKGGRLNPGIGPQLSPPAAWLPSHVDLPRRSWWCRRGQPGTRWQSTSLAFLLFGPDGSNRHCKSSSTNRSLPRTPSCRPVTCEAETGTTRRKSFTCQILKQKPEAELFSHVPQDRRRFYRRKPSCAVNHRASTGVHLSRTKQRKTNSHAVPSRQIPVEKVPTAQILHPQGDIDHELHQRLQGHKLGREGAG